MTTRRERLREQTLQEIKEMARQQMAESGTAAVSLNAIARKMGLTTPALYRYFKNRDDLITSLVAESFNNLADTLASTAQQSPADPGEKLLNVILAYRQWALDHPIDFELIYGNPIPDYQAPAEITTPAAQRGFSVILEILNAAYESGRLHPLPEYINLPADLQLNIPDRTAAFPSGTDRTVFYIGLVGWYRIHGIIMLELFHHIQPLVGNPEAFYKHEVMSLLKSAGFFNSS